MEFLDHKAARGAFSLMIILFDHGPFLDDLSCVMWKSFPLFVFLASLTARPTVSAGNSREK